MTKAQILRKKENKQSNMSVKGGMVAKNKLKKLEDSKSNKVVLIKKKHKNGNANNISKSIPKTKNTQEYKKDKSINKEEIENNGFDPEIECFNDSHEIIKDNLKNKRVKMFKGVKTIKNNSNVENTNDSEIDEEENESDFHEAEDNIGLKALLGDSIIDDDDDDDDFNEDDESDEDKNISDEEVTSFDDSKQSLSDNEVYKDNEKKENDGLGLKALLGESLVDDDDDDDFKEEEEDDDDDDDDDISDETDEDDIINKSKLSKKSFIELQNTSSNVDTVKQSKLDARTIFVGNIPSDTPIKTIEQLFKPYGKIENIRIRGVVPNDNRMSFKVATITKKIHPKVQSLYVFIVFKEEISAKEAIKLNGHKLKNNTLRVDLSKSKNKVRDQKKSIFVGNLPFGKYVSLF
jgi:hypothetical protein